MEVKFASNKKGPAAPKEPDKPAAPAPAPAPPPPAEGGEAQFKKLMPIAIIGLILIAGLLIYMARRPSTPNAANGTKVATKGTTPKRTGLRMPGLQRPRFQKPRLRRPTAGAWQGHLFPTRRAAAPQSGRVAVARRVRTRSRAAAPVAAPPTKAAPAATLCLIFGAIKSSNRALAQADISAMSKSTRGMIWPAKLKLHTKPCCKVVLGPYPKGKRQKAIGQYNKLKAHYRARSLSEYNGLLDEIFPVGLGWESCP